MSQNETPKFEALGAEPATRSESETGERMQSPQAPSRFQRTIHRLYTQAGVDPFSLVQWETRTAAITNELGETIFEQKDVEMPTFWSAMATNVVVSKYFNGPKDSPKREKSLRQVIGRVARTLMAWGQKTGQLPSPEQADVFRDELTHILLHQAAAFNSPVWFNMGIEEHPQCSACFINSVDDTMESILDLAKIEGMLFKYGSGAGTNLSPIRSSRETLSSGGGASGPVSFMRGYDAFAGVIKSGGKTRRAAKMVILNIDHPDIEEFIACKANEEKKAWALIAAGYDGSFGGEAYNSVFFQNSNNSVRVTEDFMLAVLREAEWSTRAITNGRIVDTYRARHLWKLIAESAWLCGDPGVQFDTTINDWHTCPESGRINASNPCSEYMFLDNSACNLSSLNLMKFLRPDGMMDLTALRHAVDILITAQEIIVDNASYPTKPITDNSKRYRTLGLGYANLGALLMNMGIPYDSPQARAYAGAITAVMTGQAYRTSAELAGQLGPFDDYRQNESAMLRVIRKHSDHVDRIERQHIPEDLFTQAKESWNQALTLGTRHGFRNAQVTVLAPTGTIAFMMDCDTTGVEPDVALVKYKKLVGGGMLKIVNQRVPHALKNLGYTEEQVQSIVAFIEENDTIENAPGLMDEHLPVFDCACRPNRGVRSISPMGHVRMMAAVQPFISGAISKTVNLPNEATVDDIAEIYLEAWKLGLKSLAVYRDGCKLAQPLNTQKDSAAQENPAASAAPQPYKPVRRRLPDERQAITHHFSIGGHDGYLTVGMYPDGSPGEVFLVMAKEGSVVSGMMDGFATTISLSLQYGVPLRILVNKFAFMRFEPSGWTGNPEIPFAMSFLDYIFRWLALKFLSAEDLAGLNFPLQTQPKEPLVVGVGENGQGSENGALAEGMDTKEHAVFTTQSDAPPCPTCGSILVRSGSCYRCTNCGTTNGCS